MLKRFLTFLTILLFTGPAFAKDAAPAAPLLTYAFTVTLKPGAPLELGEVEGGKRRFIPILGGVASGPKLQGQVLPGGGDWQTVTRDGIAKIDARYFLKLDDATIVEVSTPGVRVASADIAGRLAQGEDVDPNLYYYRLAPQLRVKTGAQDWLTRTVFIAKGARRPDRVTFDFYAVE
jgi:hypothetical protein